MTAVNTARGTARRAANSRVLEWLTRMGFIGYGVLHLAIAWLAVQIAVGRSGQEGDQSGALQTLAAQPFGKFLLVLIAVGLVAMAIWQLLLAAIGHRDKQGKARTFERVASGARTVVYAVLAYTATKVVMGAPTSSAQQQRKATAGVMAHTAGAWLIGLIGVGVFALGVGLAWYGAKHKFVRKLNLAGARPNTRRAARWLGALGYVAKGVAFAIVGALLVDAAATNDPNKSTGLDAALRTLVREPFGEFLLIVVGIGIAAFGIYCFFQSRYRKVGS
jgi:hypothetical protein